MKAFEVTLACLQGRGPRKQVHRWILVAVAHAGPFEDVEAWRPFTIDYAASQTGCNKNTVKKWLPQLVDDGWLNVRRMGRGRATLYSVNAAQLGPNFTPQTSPPKLNPPEQEGSPSFTKNNPMNGPKLTHSMAQTSPIFRVLQSSSEEERGSAPAHEPADSFNPPSWQSPVQRILDEHFGLNFRLETAVLGWLENGHKILPADIGERSELFMLELTARVEAEDFDPKPEWVLNSGVKRWAKRKRGPVSRAFLPAVPEPKTLNPSDYARPAGAEARERRPNPSFAAALKAMTNE